MNSLKPRFTIGRLIGALGLVLSLLLPATLHAGGDRSHGEGRLWRVDKPGAAPSHVFGTMHTSDPQVVDLPTEVRQAFEGSERLVLELVLTSEAGMELAQAMVMTDGRTLPDVIGDERFAKVLEGARRYGLPATQMQIFRPWAVMTFFSLPPAELKREIAGKLPLDQMLQTEAKAAGTPVHGLESATEQISVFTELPEADQIALLDVALILNPSIDRLFEEMKQAYLAGDLNRLHEMSQEQSAGTDPRLAELFEDRLIGHRNQIMVERMQEYLTAGGAFVAVGALHLSGDDGILSLLEDQGYTVERVL
ncbi:MAG: TraB/GumN family protein [Pseudomonadota bacterium]